MEWLVACKIALPFVSLMFLNWITAKWLLVGLSALIVYSLADTLTHLLILMMMSDIQRPSANPDSDMAHAVYELYGGSVGSFGTVRML